MKSMVLFFVLFLMASPLLFGDLMTQRGAPAQQTPSVPNQIQKHAPADTQILISQKDLPLTITAPGSYRFASNLAGGSASIVITIASSGVSIDLAGFTIQGQAGTAIAGGGATIRNGTIRGFDYGIATGEGSAIEDLTVRAFVTGISVGTDSRINRATAYSCRNGGGTGIVTGDYSIVSQSSGGGCGDAGYGIRTGAHSVISDSVGDGDQFAGAGITAGPYSTLRSVTAEGDIDLEAFSVLCGSVSIGSAIHINGGNTVVTDATTGELWVSGESNRISGCSAQSVQIDGDGNVVKDCAVSYDIHIPGDGNRIEGNHIRHGGIWDEGEGNILIGNTNAGQ